MTTAVPLHMVNAEFLAEELRSRGWRCEPDTGQCWEKPCELSERLGLQRNYVSRLLSRGHRPPGLEITRVANSRRIALVRCTEQAEQWIRARRQKRL